MIGTMPSANTASDTPSAQPLRPSSAISAISGRASTPASSSSSHHHQQQQQQSGEDWIKSIHATPTPAKIQQLTNMINAVQDKDEKVFNGFKVHLKTNLKNLQDLVTETEKFSNGLNLKDEGEWLDEI